MCEVSTLFNQQFAMGIASKEKEKIFKYSKYSEWGGIS